MSYEELLTMTEAARKLGMTRQGLHRLAKKGIVGRRIGPYWFFTPEELDTVRALPKTAGRPPGSKIGIGALSPRVLMRPA